jgi:hypothetical protein
LGETCQLRVKGPHEGKFGARSSRTAEYTRGPRRQEIQTGKKPPSLLPESPIGGVREKDQVVLEDADLYICTLRAAVDRYYYAQPVRATASMLIVAVEHMQTAHCSRAVITRFASSPGFAEPIFAVPSNLPLTIAVLTTISRN